MIRMLVLVLVLLAAPCALAQHAGGAAPLPSMTAPAQARQFDFLIGQWDIVVKPKVSSVAAMIHGQPTLSGTWKAWRAFDGFGVDDEMRIVDGSGNPRSLSRALRVYSQAEQRWNLVTLDVYRARFSNATAQMKDAELVSNGRGVDGEGKEYQTRTRYFDIGPDAFKMQQDRSYDAGETWNEAALLIEAKRTAAAAPR